MLNISPDQIAVDTSQVFQLEVRIPAELESKNYEERRAWWNQELSKATTPQRLADLLGIYTAMMGFTGTHSALYIPALKGRKVHFSLNGYDRAWWNLYVERQYIAVDPIVRRVMYHANPFEWHEMDFSKVTPKTLELFSEAIKYGICGGFNWHFLTAAVNGSRIGSIMEE